MDTTVESSRRRKQDRVHLDLSLNINTIIAVLALIFTMVRYGNEIVSHLKSIDSKTNIMWTHFDKSQLTKEEINSLIEK
jgi:hypothetical protein